MGQGQSVPNDQTKGGMVTVQFIGRTKLPLRTKFHPLFRRCFSFDRQINFLYRTWTDSLPPCVRPCCGPLRHRRRRPLHRDFSCSSQRRFGVRTNTSVTPKMTARPKSTTTMMSRPGAKSHQWRSLRFDSRRITRRTEVKGTPAVGLPRKKVRSTTRWRRFTHKNTHGTNRIKRQDLKSPTVRAINSLSDFLVDSSLPHQFSVQQCSLQQRPDCSLLLLLSHFDKFPKFPKFFHT